MATELNNGELNRIWYSAVVDKRNKFIGFVSTNSVFSTLNPSVDIVKRLREKAKSFNGLLNGKVFGLLLPTRREDKICLNEILKQI